MSEPTETDRRGIVAPTITDRDGRRWTIDLNFDVYRRVLGNCDVDLCDIVYEEQRSLTQLQDPATLVDVLYEIVRDQADEQRVDERSFARSLDMPIVADALKKLIDQMLFFSRNHPRAAIVREVVTAADEAEKRMVKEVDKAIPTLRKKMQEALSAPGGLDGLLQESLASTPGSGPSDNWPGPPTANSERHGITPPASSPATPRPTAIPRSATSRTRRRTSTRSKK